MNRIIHRFQQIGSKTKSDIGRRRSPCRGRSPSCSCTGSGADAKSDDWIPLPQATSLDRLSRPCPCAKSRHRWSRPTSQTTIAPKGRTPQAPRQHLPQRRRAGARAGEHYFDGAPTIAPSIHRRRKPNLGTTPRTYIHAAPRSKVPLTSSRPGGRWGRGKRSGGPAEERARRSRR